MKSKIEELFGADLRSLAALRIGVALVLILDLCQRASDLEAHYSDFGVAPRSLVIDNLDSRWFVSLHLLSGAWQVQALLFLLAGVLAGALLIGYRTGIATVGSWILCVSLNARNFHVVGGGDMLLRAVLFWSMFLPLGAYYSVDRAWARFAGKLPKRIVSWGTAAFAAQILALYWFSVLGKSGAEWWREGSAVYYALSIDYIVTPLGQWLLHLPPPVLRLATRSVLAFEIVGPLLLFVPWFTGPVRTLAVFGFVALHLVFLFTLLVGLFPLIAIVSMLFFLPSWFWDGLLPQFCRAPRKPVTVYYDGDCGFCEKSVQLIKTFLLLPPSQILPAQSNPAMAAVLRENNSWVVVDASGRQFLRYQGVIALARSARLLVWLAPILCFGPFERIGERAYRYIADHRAVSCQVPAVGAAGDSALGLRPSAATGTIAMVMMVYMLVWNIANVRVTNFKIPERVRAVGNLVGLDQTWEMFAPFPAKDDGWYVIPGRLKNGRQIDLQRGGQEINWEKPKYIALTIKNHRWRKFFELLKKRDYLVPGYASYLCRNWNRSHAGNERLEELEIVFLLEWTRPNFEYFEPRKLSLLKYRCAAASAKSSS